MITTRHAKSGNVALVCFDSMQIDMRAYVVRGIDLHWQAKRLRDGEVLVKDESRADAKAKAEQLGYVIIK